MASLSTRTLIHYSKERITDLANMTREQRTLLQIWGKPMGFWYAYGEDWKEYVTTQHTGNNTQRGHTKKNTAVRHEFLLPEEAFVTEVKEATPNTIFELSKSNLDAFMKRFLKKTHRITLPQMLEMAFTNMVTEGGPGAILGELSKKDEKFGEFIDLLLEYFEEDAIGELIEMIGMGDAEYDNKEDDLTKGLVTYTRKTYKKALSGYSPSREAQTRDHIHLLDWGAFWRDVSRKVGGIEFHSDLFDMDSWEDVWLPWVDKLSVRSGVVFHPSRFRGGILIEQLKSQVMGGAKRRRTQRKRQAGSRRR